MASVLFILPVRYNKVFIVYRSVVFICVRVCVRERVYEGVRVRACVGACTRVRVRVCCARACVCVCEGGSACPFWEGPGAISNGNIIYDGRCVRIVALHPQMICLYS